MHRMLKNKHQNPPALTGAGPANRWDPTESDTESLAQERAYQQQVQRYIGCSNEPKFIQSREENANRLQQGDSENTDINDDETEHLGIYDSLEVTELSQVKDCARLPTEYLNTGIKQGKAPRHIVSDDAYSDLRYDPNWRTNLKGANCFNESLQLSVEEFDHMSGKKSSQPCGERPELVKHGYRCIISTDPPIETPQMTSDECDHPYRLHPHDDQTASVASHHHNHALQHRLPENGHASPSILTESEKTDDSCLHRGFRIKHEKSRNCAAEKMNSSPELAGYITETNAMYVQEFESYYEQEPGHIQSKAKTQQATISTLKNSKLLANKKLQMPTEDIVERNKFTLGRGTSKCGSYLKAHAQKQETPQVMKIDETPKEMISADTEDSSGLEQRWLQKTQQLRVTQLSKERKTKRKENSSPRQHQQLPAPRMNAKQGPGLSLPLERPVAKSHPKPQTLIGKMQPSPPSIHLNINLNTTSHLLPFVQQQGQDSFINLATLHCPLNQSPSLDVRYMNSPFSSDASVQQFSSPSAQLQGSQLVLDSRYQQTNAGKSSQMFQERRNVDPHHWNPVNFPGHWQRPKASKWPLPWEGEDQTRSPNEFPTEKLSENCSSTPTTTLTQDSAPYEVLPPIGKLMLGKEDEPNPRLNVNTTRSSSDSYLVQMEKQKQLKAKVTYQAYSLKEYKQLTPAVKLRGLGPDYAAVEKTKMRRQKLYSNVIREQNKKISRIPFLPAKDLGGNNKEDARMKALEYAKTIAKPQVQSQPKAGEQQQSDALPQPASYLKDLDASQLATLELLRKRHEEEKQAVALFRKVHAV